MTTCPLCGAPDARRAFRARDYEHGVPGEWDIAHCTSCGFYFLDPIPHSSELGGFYPPTYSAYNPDPIMRAAFRMVYRQDAKQMAKLLPSDSGSVLDVGCGNGSALSELGALGDWDLFGLEIDPGAAQMAREKGIHARAGTLDQSDYEDGSFDLIRLGHVIEHVVDPKETIERVYRMLKPGGILFGETPNTDCADFRIFGKYWGALHVPRHITFFNDRNLEKALRDAGFDEVHIGWHNRPVGWAAGVQNWLHDKFNMKVPDTGRVRWYIILMLIFTPIATWQKYFSKTATVRFHAKKV